MNTQPDFEELLKLLEENNVRYMIVGGYAVAFHGFPRFTKDLDIYYTNNKQNITKLRKALTAFGFNQDELPEALFETDGNIIKFGIEPVRVDLLNKIDGIIFDEAERNTVKGRYGKIHVNFIGKDDLIKNKSSTKRLQDQADVDTLKQ